ncbi:Coiled-coil domain-containing protein 67, partial [Chlamydotis macqueenii]
QTQNCKFQISNKKQNQEEVTTYGQPESEKDELIIEKLKATVNEIAVNKNKLEEENLKLREDLKMYQNQCQNMEANFSEMRNELQSRDALWRRIQLECQQLHTELLKIREYKDMQEVKIKHQSSCVQLTEQLENKKAASLLLAQSQERQREELNKIRNRVYREEQSHRSEQERMKTEISDLTEELHQKEITIATIMEKAGLLERQLKMELEIKDKLLAKQQLSDFRYKVIKSENTLLKEMVENQECKSCTSTDLSNEEHGNSTASVHKLTHENVRLQNSLVKLQNDIETSILDCMDTYGETEHSYQSHSKTQEKEESSEDILVIKDLVFSFSRLCQAAQGYSLLFTNHDFLFIAQTSPEMSILATTEKFLQEEEKHTIEFEERLNLHLEELQRHSENTLKKYTRIQQSRHT